MIEVRPLSETAGNAWLRELARLLVLAAGNRRIAREGQIPRAILEDRRGAGDRPTAR